ncbi:MAG: hypothetical protein AVDCRST_MAG07-132, partial [uncultured Frankineae bacterium]
CASPRTERRARGVRRSGRGRTPCWSSSPCCWPCGGRSSCRSASAGRSCRSPGSSRWSATSRWAGPVRVWPGAPVPCSPAPCGCSSCWCCRPGGRRATSSSRAPPSGWSSCWPVPWRARWRTPWPSCVRARLATLPGSRPLAG